jgi:AraC-like DNA-binding protein
LRTYIPSNAVVHVLPSSVDCCQNCRTYLSQLRLRASLEPLLDGTAPITDIALAHGYSSHSHYTNAFREALGITPSAARRAPYRVPNVTR